MPKCKEHDKNAPQAERKNGTLITVIVLKMDLSAITKISRWASVTSNYNKNFYCTQPLSSSLTRECVVLCSEKLLNVCRHVMKQPRYKRIFLEHMRS